MMTATQRAERRARRAEKKLARISAIYNTEKQVKVKGMARPVTQSTHAYYNLEGAIIDLERTGCDAISLRTLKRVSTQLALIGKVLKDG